MEMTWKEFKLKIRKRWHYFLAKRKSIETYYMTVVGSTKDVTTFNYYGYVFKARLKSSSDYDMVKQVLIDGEYKIPTTFFIAQNLQPKHIIDAGSNIGSTTIYLKHIFPKSKVYCIEPDPDNFVLLQENVEDYVSDGSVVLYKAGLMAKSGLNLIVKDDFRDKSSCARQVAVSDEISGLKSITISEIIKENSIDSIDLLKIDIEGAETFLIEEESDVSFLKKTRCIAIEIHNEYKCRDAIYELLISHGFILLSDNETTIAINKKWA